MPERIQLKRTKGWRKPEGAINVARPTKWGNPYRVINGMVYGPRGGPLLAGELVAYSTHAPPAGALLAAIQMYRQDIGCVTRTRLTVDMIRRELADRDLACWCPPDRPCHADVLLEIANSPGGGSDD